MSTDKPREWWICEVNKQNVLPQNRAQYAYDKEQMEYMAKYDDEGNLKGYVHVIEKSAFDKLAAELAECKADYQREFNENMANIVECERLDIECAALRAERDEALLHVSRLQDIPHEENIKLKFKIEDLQKQVAELKDQVYQDDDTTWKQCSDYWQNRFKKLQAKLTAAEAELAGQKQCHCRRGQSSGAIISVFGKCSQCGGWV